MLAAKQRRKRVDLSHLLQLQYSSAQVPTVLDEIRIMLDLSFDFLLQPVELVVDGLRERIQCQLGFFG